MTAAVSEGGTRVAAVRGSPGAAVARGRLVWPAEEPRSAEGWGHPTHLGHSGRANRIEGPTPWGSQGRVALWGTGRGEGTAGGVCRAAASRAAQPPLEVEEGAGQADVGARPGPFTPAALPSQDPVCDPHLLWQYHCP